MLKTKAPTLLFFILVFSASIAVSQDYHAEKMNLLYELNIARSDPQFYGLSVGVDLSDYQASGELQWDNNLAKEAQRFSKELFDNKTLFHSTMPFRESILWNYEACNAIRQFIIDAGVPDLGHRKHLLDGSETKIGIGITKGWVGHWNRVYVVILTI